MGKIEYTAEQKQVINLRNANLLVSAAAGSGKTAVLTQRIISLITDKDNPVDIDRILVVTFTRAAAAEMRERIAKAISRKLEEEPDNANLLRQMTLLHNAQITTIDSFCLYIIRNNFGDIHLDPAFRIMDAGEKKLMMKDILGEILEECYQEESNDAFFYLTESYGGNKNDEALEEMILSVYEYAMSYPNPEEWVKNAAGIELEQMAILGETLEECEEELENAWQLAKEAMALCQREDGPAAYLSTIKAQYELLEQLRLTNDFSKRTEILGEAVIPSLSGGKKKTEDPEIRAEAKVLKERISEILDRWKKELYFDEFENLKESERAISYASKELIRIVLLFMKRFGAEKREKNVIDFSDMEHLALQILTANNENGEPEPSDAAKEYQQYFECIMVDEYQDSNYVQEYILKSIARDDNYFMVGDVKQSIYRFRQARPEIFLEKYHTYGNTGKNIVIHLNSNFRSRKEVLESANDVFEKIMTKKTAGLIYDENARLYCGRNYPEIPGQDMTSELVLIENPDAEDKTDFVENAKDFEALYIANRIQEMMKKPYMVTDDDTGEIRPVRYGDFVILLRSVKGYDESLQKILGEYGIPVYMNTKTGYFDALEVRYVMNLLRTLDNPRQDIPLYGTMHSVFGGFSEEELALIKSYGKNQCLYEAVELFLQEESDKTLIALKERLSSFVENINRYRGLARYTGVRELIETIIREYGYLDYVTAMPGGDQRKANIMMLLERATDFESTNYYGLFHFVRYIEQLKAQEVDYGEAGILDENADVVRIITMHKSKGLEFPVCFLCGLGKTLNKKDAKKAMLLDSEYGFALDYVNPEKRIKCPSLRKNLIARKIVRESIAEEMRVLYVAMTRAKEKLIMTGTVRNMDTTMDALTDGQMDKNIILGAGTYLDFILQAYAGQNKLGTYVKCKTSQDILGDMVHNSLKTSMSREELMQLQLPKDEKLLSVIRDRLSCEYPYPKLRGLFTKTTVSELKKASISDEMAQELFETEKKNEYIPKFIRGEESESGGTKRGTAVHRIMELLDYERLSDLEPAMYESFIKDTMTHHVSTGMFLSEYVELINVKKCVNFLNGSLANRMMKAAEQQLLYKEKAFFIGLPANRLKAEFPEEELVLVQGVIDVYFEEDGELVLADYKTDRVKDEQTLLELYRKQLDIYAEALEQITGKKVKEKIIYSFALETEIRL